MTPERWQKIKSVLAAVLERTVEERAVFLDHTCDGDESLRAEVESLMAHQEVGDSIVDSAKISSQISLASAILSGEFLSNESSDFDETPMTSPESSA